MEDVAGRVAFITGGASGIGLGMAKAFAAAGMKVAIADIEKPAIDRALKEFQNTNADVIGIECDVTDRDSMERAAQETEKAFGKVHVVCLNAGVGGGGPMDETTYDDWDWVLGVNLNGVVNGIQSFVNRIKKHGEGGHIVNTASMAGLLAGGGMGVYNASKFAVVGISESLRADLERHGIGVSVLCPGFVATNIGEGDRNRPKELSDTREADPERREAVKQFLAAGMQPEEVGEKVLAAIRANELYILTHPEFKDAVAARMNAILASFKDEPVDPKRLEVMERIRQQRIVEAGEKS